MNRNSKFVVIYSLVFLILSYYIVIATWLISSDLFIRYYRFILATLFLVGMYFYTRKIESNDLIIALAGIICTTFLYSFKTGDLRQVLYPSSEIRTFSDLIQVQISNYYIYTIGIIYSLRIIYNNRKQK